MHPSPILYRAIKRLALTTKQGPHNYYKGNRTGSLGRHTKWGGYVVQWSKVRTYRCPELEGFHVCASLLPIFLLDGFDGEGMFVGGSADVLIWCACS